MKCVYACTIQYTLYTADEQSAQLVVEIHIATSTYSARLCVYVHYKEYGTMCYWTSQLDNHSKCSTHT